MANVLCGLRLENINVRAWLCFICYSQRLKPLIIHQIKTREIMTVTCTVSEYLVLISRDSNDIISPISL